MTADPTEPDTFAEKEDVVLDEEIPEADAAEQHAELQQREDEPLPGSRTSRRTTRTPWSRPGWSPSTRTTTADEGDGAVSRASPRSRVRSVSGSVSGGVSTGRLPLFRSLRS